jgi:hypothetical protein
VGYEARPLSNAIRSIQVHQPDPRNLPPILDNEIQSPDAAGRSVDAKAGKALIKAPDGIPDKAESVSANIHGM